MADAASVQQEIATAISGKLRVRLTSEEKNRSAKSSAANPEAYQLYLRGRYFANQPTAAGLKKSIEYFEQAIDISIYLPGFMQGSTTKTRRSGCLKRLMNSIRLPCLI